MSQALKKITIKGFKSIASLEDFELGNLNVLIGANGAGKSNFVDFFRMLRAMAEENLTTFVERQGGGNGFFYLGPQHTRQIYALLEFGDNKYEFLLEPTADNNILVADETGQSGVIIVSKSGKGTRESFLRHFQNFKMTDENSLEKLTPIYEWLSACIVYHFHDTSILAPMRRDQSVRDWEYLRPDASNIAAYLLHLSQHNSQTYSLIRDTIRQIAPFFDDFLLRPVTKGPEELVRLEWKQKGSDFPFQPYQLSDGTIRFICLATALLQPNPPSTMIIDEPELGLHPFALTLLAAMIQSTSTRTQIIISTQSPALVDQFEPEQIIVVNRSQGQSIFERLSAESLKEWLEEYTIGELWQKNVIQGDPSNE